MTDRIIQAPSNRSATVDLGRHVFRKPFLRRGHSIDYPLPDGTKRKLVFDDAYLSNVLNASKAGAFDLVPLVLDPGDNKHTENPEQFRGRVLGVEETPDGLDALVEVNDDVTAKLLRDYPDLAVSARLMENYAPDGGGKTFPVAMKHLFVTANPRVAKLGQWQEASLSGQDAAEVIDLSHVETPMGNVDLAAAALQERWDALTDEERAELLEIADVLNAEDDEPVTPDDVPQGEKAPKPQVEPDTSDDEETEPVTEQAELSAAQEAIDLARDARLAQQGEEISQLQQQLHGEQWGRERDSLQLDGVPPWALDLAAPYLGDRQASVVDLSGVEDDSNPAAIIRKLLGGMKGQIDLSGTRGYTATQDSDEMTEEALVKNWFEQMHPNSVPAHLRDK